MTTVIDSSLAARLRADGFVGRVVEPDDPGYDDARAGWNGAIDRRPPPSPTPSDADDVAAAVRAARAAGSRSRSAPAGTRSPAARCATARSASTCGR